LFRTAFLIQSDTIYREKSYWDHRAFFETNPRRLTPGSRGRIAAPWKVIQHTLTPDYGIRMEPVMENMDKKGICNNDH